MKTISKRDFVAFGVAVGGLASPRLAFSQEAVYVGKAAGSARIGLEQSHALFGNRAHAISELWAVAERCAEADWDGYGAEAIDLDSVLIAQRLLRALPEGDPMPEITPEPDGHVSLDWFGPHRRVFSVSASPNGRLACAWLNASERGHSVIRFDGERVPREVLTRARETMRP